MLGQAREPPSLDFWFGQGPTSPARRNSDLGTVWERPGNSELIANGSRYRLLDFKVVRNRGREPSGWKQVDGVPRALAVDDAAVFLEMPHQSRRFMPEREPRWSRSPRGRFRTGAVGFEQQLYGLLDHLPRFLEIPALADRAGKLRHLGQDPTVFELLINDRELGAHRGLTAQLAVCMKL